jgi:hypothetical protein
MREDTASPDVAHLQCRAEGEDSRHGEQLQHIWHGGIWCLRKTWMECPVRYLPTK